MFSNGKRNRWLSILFGIESHRPCKFDQMYEGAKARYSRGDGIPTGATAFAWLLIKLGWFFMKSMSQFRWTSNRPIKLIGDRIHRDERLISRFVHHVNRTRNFYVRRESIVKVGRRDAWRKKRFPTVAIYWCLSRLCEQSVKSWTESLFVWQCITKAQLRDWLLDRLSFSRYIKDIHVLQFSYFISSTQIGYRVI